MVVRPTFLLLELDQCFLKIKPKKMAMERTQLLAQTVWEKRNKGKARLVEKKMGTRERVSHHHESQIENRRHSLLDLVAVVRRACLPP